MYYVKFLVYKKLCYTSTDFVLKGLSFHDSYLDLCPKKSYLDSPVPAFIQRALQEAGGLDEDLSLQLVEKRQLRSFSRNKVN